LFPDLELDWADIQLVDGKPLSWLDYQRHELHLAENLLASDTCLLSQMLDKSRYLVEIIGPGVEFEHIPSSQINPAIVDALLVRELLSLYFPRDVYLEPECNFVARAFAEKLIAAAANPASVNWLDESLSFDALGALKLGRLDAESESLLRRFVYCRIFSKLYFGPGLGSLSLLAGFHHLAILMALLRIDLKVKLASSEERNGAAPTFEQVAESLRCLERRLTVATFSLEATATLEALLQSPARLKRIMAMAG
ncbi:MAG TPA: hypothetical protein V6C72_10355, partial [Chroococcales cyanobacterium]